MEGFLESVSGVDFFDLVFPEDIQSVTVAVDCPPSVDIEGRDYLILFDLIDRQGGSLTPELVGASVTKGYGLPYRYLETSSKVDDWLITKPIIVRGISSRMRLGVAPWSKSARAQDVSSSLAARMICEVRSASNRKWTVKVGK